MLILKVKERGNSTYRVTIVNDVKDAMSVERITEEYPPEGVLPKDRPGNQVYGRYVYVSIGDIKIAKTFIKFNEINAMDFLRKAEKKMDKLANLIASCICNNTISKANRINIEQRRSYFHGIIEDKNTTDIILTIEEDRVIDYEIAHFCKSLTKDVLKNMIEDLDK